MTYSKEWTEKFSPCAGSRKKNTIHVRHEIRSEPAFLYIKPNILPPVCLRMVAIVSRGTFHIDWPDRLNAGSLALWVPQKTYFTPVT